MAGEYAHGTASPSITWHSKRGLPGIAASSGVYQNKDSYLTLLYCIT